MTRPSERRPGRTSVRGLGRAVGGVLFSGLVVVGCGAPPPELTLIAVPTAPPSDACLLALVGGRVVASERWAIALQDTTGRVSKVLWPNGFRGVQDGVRLALVDRDGRVVAQVGDTISSGGGFVGPNGDPDNTMLVCGPIKVVQP
ncbi:MAG: hypothetical protein M3Q66_03740 [Chloroflexota bacterium]|nr:hypothetical protein [Chloroflexota bacterium]